MQKKIAIQLSKYFTRNSWEYSLNKYLPDYTRDYNVQYASTGNELKELFLEAEACFCFSFNEDIDLKQSGLQLIYLGISDIDYLDKFIFPGKVSIYSSKGIASELIAEYSLMVSLMLLRNFQFSIINKLKKKWDQEPFLNQAAGSIRDYKIGVLGLGNNGKAIVNIFKSIGCWVAGYSINEKENLKLDSWFPKDRLNEILEICDIIIVSLPLRSETKHLIGLEQLQIMGSDSHLINVSRGEIINENDLIIALKRQMIKTAAVDVCSIEPLPKKSKLWKIPNLLISPHIAGNVNYFVENIQRDFINKVKITL
ncbi:MAG: hypothetical protein JSV88_18070 [Candidatus Aminicenantes bacterium]|nr:MAG: hypothetical protein JSV88_18070 [Candidatus Aminicenantes bacterium]